VKRAEAEAESMYLSGVGVARQRKAIMMGLKYVMILRLMLFLCVYDAEVFWQH
jgi:hypothetical protein